MEKVTQAQVTVWLNHPVTKHFIAFMAEFRRSNKEYLESIVLGTPPDGLKNVTGQLAQLKGQLHVLDELLDTKQFIINELDTNNLLMTEELKNL